MTKEEYAKLVITLLNKANTKFNNYLQEETIIAWAEDLFKQRIKPKDLKTSLDNLCRNEDYLKLKLIYQYLPKELETNIIECLRKAIDYKGLSNLTIYTSGKNEGKTCYQASMEKMYELAGAEGVMVFKEYAHDFKNSEPGSTDQQFRIKKIKEYYEDLKHRLELNPNLLDNKFSKPNILVENKIKKLLGGNQKC